MNEKLIKYFAGEMSSSEKVEFEKKINESPTLKEEVSKYHDFFSNINETVEPEVEESYFIDLVPRFRDKLVLDEKKKYHPLFSFATAAVTVIIILLFIPNSNRVVRDDNTSANYSSTDITNYLNTNSDQPIVTNLPADVEANYDSLLDGMIYDELSNNGHNLAGAQMVESLDYNTLLESVNNNDAAVIYEQLKNKKIF